MQVKSLEVTAIVLDRVDSKTHKLNLNIMFSDGSSLPMEMALEENFDLVIEKLLKQVKTMKKTNSDNDDDFLPDVYIVNIKNEDDIKEKAPKRLYMLDRRLESLKQAKYYKEYMNLYSQLSTMQDVIYEKN